MDIRMDMCTDMCFDMCTDMCVDMCVGMCTRSARLAVDAVVAVLARITLLKLTIYICIKYTD